jgi:hypothetical protein
MSTKILSYKGLMANNSQERILLSTKKGEKGYRITKFQLMGNAPGTLNYESIMKIYKDEQSGVDGIIDFSDNRLIGAGFLEGSTSVTSTDGIVVIFDNEIFNQDIFITHIEIEGGAPCNYYLELEVIMLNETEATVATLKDIRNNA